MLLAAFVDSGSTLGLLQESQTNSRWPDDEWIPTVTWTSTSESYREMHGDAWRHIMGAVHTEGYVTNLLSFGVGEGG